MSSAVFDIWTWRGKMGRRRYLVTGLVLFALKHNIDRLLATLFGYPWGPFNYLVFYSPDDCVGGLSSNRSLKIRRNSLLSAAWSRSRSSAAALVA